MNGPFANIFLAIQARIQAQVTAIEYIDFNIGQLDMPQRPTVAFPCVLIDFEEFSFTDDSLLIQDAAGLVRVTLAYAPYSSTESHTPDDYKEAALNYLDLEWNVNKALHGFEPTDISGHMMRHKTRADRRRPGLAVRDIYYTLSFMDNSCRPGQSTAPATPSVTPQIDLP